MLAYVGNDPINFVDPLGKDRASAPIDGTKAGISFATSLSGLTQLALNPNLGPMAVELIWGAGTTGELLGALAAGLTVGTALDWAYTQVSGQSLGDDIYDWLHPEDKRPAVDPIRIVVYQAEGLCRLWINWSIQS